jgi:hypothetical protein
MQRNGADMHMIVTKDFKAITCWMASWVLIPVVWCSLSVFITTASKARHILSENKSWNKASFYQKKQKYACRIVESHTKTNEQALISTRKQNRSCRFVFVITYWTNNISNKQHSCAS